MSWGRLAVENFRGVRVPRVLGLGLGGLAVAWTAGAELIRTVEAPAWGALAGSLLVLMAGLVDDLVPGGRRGLRDHLASLLSGRMTTGILKVVVTAGAAAVVIALQPRRGFWVEIAGILLLAACTNLWNGLDVRPGRALKAFLPAALAFVVAGELWLAPAILGLFVGALLALPLDLSERAMLGDGGANLLGFAAGLGLYLVLLDWGVWLAAAAAIGLNLLAETVTLSRTIDAAGPLRWLDRLGRRADP